LKKLSAARKCRRVLAATVLFAPVMAASILPILRLEPQTLESYDAYVANYEKGSDFAASGRFWIDGEGASRRTAFDQGRIIVQIRKSENIPGGHIHHLFGTMHVPNVTVDMVRHRMENYADYTTIYKPDVEFASGEPVADTTPDDLHFKVTLKLAQSTLWFDVAFDTVYDTHYMRFGPARFESRSRSMSIREWRAPRDPSLGTFPEGQDHGFLWRVYTWWHVRERNGGAELEVNNITLTRAVPTGFGWWASRKARQSIENLLSRTRIAMTDEK
jgi:hypothetical protein